MHESVRRRLNEMPGDQLSSHDNSNRGASLIQIIHLITSVHLVKILAGLNGAASILQVHAAQIGVKGMSKLFGFVLILFASVQTHAQAQQNQWLQFFPLNTGDVWEYRVIHTGTLGPDTTYYGIRTVLGDTVFENGTHWKIVQNHNLSIFPVAEVSRTTGDTDEFIRVDSLTTGVCVMVDSVEVRMDSLAMKPGDSMSGTGSSAVRPFFGLVTYWELDTVSIFGQSLPARNIATYTGIESGYNETFVYCAGLGCTSRHFEHNPSWDSTLEELVYAKIDGVEYGTYVGVRTASGVVSEYRLEQNFPNPFNPSTEINYRLSSPVHVTIKVYDILGQVVSKLVDRNEAPGIHSVQFIAASLATGVYFYTLRAGNRVETRKMILLK
jgi:Secretion system C-terminal sorting domain